MSDQSDEIVADDRLQTGGNYGVRNSMMGGEGIVSEGISVGVMHSKRPPGVTVDVAFDDENNDNHVGVLAKLDPSQARELGDALINLADYAETRGETR